MKRRAVSAAIAALAMLAASGANAEDTAAAGTIAQNVFSDYTPLSGNRELARRFLSPLEAAELPALTTGAGKTLRDQPVDVANEKFVLYVPAQKPADGYGLFVFVPPWNSSRVPTGWTDVFDEHGLIFVSAMASGNDQSVLGRRIPLALLAEQNVAGRYPVNAEHVYVGGFSGGSRVALRIALAYPDIFHGVVLNSGSDPIGTRDAMIPPKDLFAIFQERTQLIFITGEDDPYIRQTDYASRHSLEDWCVTHIDAMPMRSAAHEPARPELLSKAFDELMAPVSPTDQGALQSCRSKIANQLDERLRDVQSLIAQGNRDLAMTRLNAIDQQYGGLAAPRSLELSASLTSK